MRLSTMVLPPGGSPDSLLPNPGPPDAAAVRLREDGPPGTLPSSPRAGHCFPHRSTLKYRWNPGRAVARAGVLTLGAARTSDAGALGRSFATVVEDATGSGEVNGTPTPTSCPVRCAVASPPPGQTTLPPTTDTGYSPAADAPRSSDCQTASPPADPTPRPADAANCPAPTAGSG